MSPHDFPSPTWSDARLVQECLRGSEDAWAALIDKYKKLIYSIPIKYNASREDAADIFQAVCLELFSQLSRLRKVDSLRSWLVSITTHKCLHWKRKQRQEGCNELTEARQAGLAGADTLPAELLEELDREQILREAMARLPRRCQEMIQLLFYRHPAVPYSEVAQRLGLATGSIGFIRGRCLKHLQQILEEMGF